MENLNQDAAQFDKNVQTIFNRFFKNKLTGRGFIVRILILFVAGLILSSIATSLVTASMSTSSSITNPLWPSLSLLAPLIGVLTFLSILINASLVVRRVRDIVPDTQLWPYALCAVILSLIPFLNYLIFILLALLPSNYLTQEKRSQILSKFA